MEAARGGRGGGCETVGVCVRSAVFSLCVKFVTVGFILALCPECVGADRTGVKRSCDAG